MIYYGRKSKLVLSELEDPLQRVLIYAAEITPKQFDYSLHEGYRPISKQNQLFLSGNTTIDGINKKGMHNYWPSKAVDIYPYFSGYGKLVPNVENYRKLLKFNNLPITEVNIHKAERFVISRMAITAGFIFIAADKFNYSLTWGTDWDKDGNMLDHNFQDYPHFQGVK